MWVGLVAMLAGCQAPKSNPTPKAAARTADVVVPERFRVNNGPIVSRIGDWIDAEHIYLAGAGALRIEYSEGELAAFYRRFSWSDIDQVKVRGDLEVMGEINGSDEIRTYLFRNGQLIAVIRGEDQSDFQFSSDGKHLVVVSYDQLDVVDCQTGKIVRSLRFGAGPADSSQTWLTLPPGGEGRFVRVFSGSTRDPRQVTAKWWDPIAGRPIADPIQTTVDHFVWRHDQKFYASAVGYGHATYVVYRWDDKRRYVIEDASTRATIGEIAGVSGQIMPQTFAFFGSHGLYAGGKLYDLRSRTVVATVDADVERSSYLIWTHDGHFFGNIDPKKHGLDKAKRDPERVRRALIDGLGLEEPESMSP